MTIKIGILNEFVSWGRVCASACRQESVGAMEKQFVSLHS